MEHVRTGVPRTLGLVPSAPNVFGIRYPDGARAEHAPKDIICLRKRIPMRGKSRSCQISKYFHPGKPGVKESWRSRPDGSQEGITTLERGN